MRLLKKKYSLINDNEKGALEEKGEGKLVCSMKKKFLQKIQVFLFKKGGGGELNEVIRSMIPYFDSLVIHLKTIKVTH